MKLFLLEQEDNTDYDTYDSCVVAAEGESAARMMHASGHNDQWGRNYPSWANKPENVSATYLGEAADGVQAGVICASFNAG